MTQIIDTVEALLKALQADFRALGLEATQLIPLSSSGVSHNHYRIDDGQWLLRAPRLSQLGLEAEAQLKVQATAFERAYPSGSTPRLLGLLPLSAALPRGGLVVEDIHGRLPEGPSDLPAMACALATIHGLPTPISPCHAPIPSPSNPYVPIATSASANIARYAAAAGLSAPARAAIDARLAWLTSEARHNVNTGPTCLCISDSHPGNFLIRANGSAAFVDLEKPAYTSPAIDLAHTVIAIAAGWDPDAGMVLTAADREIFINAWMEAVPAPIAEQTSASIRPIRQAVWLRTISFFMKWRAESAIRGPWSAALLGEAAAAHFRAHVDRSLTEDAILAAAEAWA